MTENALSSASDGVTVVSGGSIARTDRCSLCGLPMMFRIEAGRVVASFCATSGCSLWLVDIWEDVAVPQADGCEPASEELLEQPTGLLDDLAKQMGLETPEQVTERLRLAAFLEKELSK